MSSIIKKRWIAPLLLAGLICCKTESVKAQATPPKFDIKNLIASSPEAAMLGRFGDIPIGYYTGTADVSIPIYSIKEAGVEIPIVLSYHGSGVKVDDQATNVGLGWSLEPGGAIVQITNGVPDYLDNLPAQDGFTFLKSQSPTGTYSERYEIGDAFFEACNVVPIQDRTNLDQQPVLDAIQRGMGQPDLFQYNFAGHSGKMYINPETGNVVLINPKEQDITFIRNGSGWTAKTMDGNVFNFNTIENSGFNYDHYMGVTAKLTSIDLNIGKTINFDYQDGLYNWFNYSESFHSEYPLLLGGSDDYRVIPTLTGVDYHLKMLKKITTDKAVIDFNPEDRADLYAGVNNATPPKRIGSVDISDAVSGKKIKTLKFNYDYFQGTITNSYLTGNVTNAAALADADAKRLKLTSVQETGYTTAGVQVVKPPYTFSYNEATALPIKSSFSTDFWGYYNAQINSKAIPDLSVFYLSDDPDYAAMPAGLMTSFQGANRSPDTAKMKAGLLTKIVYPTGGTTAFTYEPNTFGNYAYPDINKIQNSSHNGYVSDYNVSSDVKTLTFSLPKTEIITFNVIITKGPNPARTYAEIQPSTVVLSKTVSGVTTTLKTWQMVTSQDEDDFNNSGTKQWNDAITLTYDANATYTITADMPDGIGPQGTSSDDASVSANFFYYSLPADYQTSYGGGVRVATIKNYTQTGGVASNKVIKYLNPDNSTSGILMSPVKPLYKRTMYGVIHSGVVPVDEYRGQVKDVWFISSESSVPFSDSAEGSVVGYSTVEEDEVAPDGSINGRHVFYYNNLESESHPNVPNNPQPLNGLISKEQVFSNTSTIPLTETNFSYININTWLYQGFKVANTFVGDNMCGSGSGYSIGIVDNDSNVLSSPIAYEHYYRIYTYPLNSYWSMLSGKTVTNNFNGQSLTSAENYFYNNKGQVVETASQNSKQETLTVKDIYPLDNPTDPMSAELISQNLYNSLQQKIILNNNAEQSHKYISYRDFNGLAVQNDVTGTFLGATLSPEPPLTDVTFDVYGPNKTVRQVTQKGVTTVLVWAFNNSFPLAEIKNTTYAAVQTALGGQSAVDAFGLTSPTKAAIDAFLAPLRSGTLTNALVTTFSIDPLIGMTSSTDEKGISTYYEYDDYQRLMNIKDKDGNIVKHIDYHYQGQ